jgi:hypothetical protein
MKHGIFTRAVLAFLAGLLLFADGFAFYGVLIHGKGTSFDLYLPWYGSREITQGHDPYTTQVTEQIQIGTLGHVAAPNENQYRFVYPAYIAFILLPFLPMPFSLAVTVWIVLQQVLLVAAFVLTWEALNWSPRPATMAAIIVVGVLFRYSLIAIVLAQNSMVTVFLLAAAVYASSRNKHEWAAIALALATFKPQLAAFPIFGWLVMMILRREWCALFAFSCAMLALIVLPFLFIGNWLAGLWNNLTTYWGYTDSQSPLTLLASLAPREIRSGIALAGALVGAANLAWVAWREREKDYAPVLALSVLLTLAIIPLSSVHDLALLILPLLMSWVVVQGREDAPVRVLRILLAGLPIVSWAIILVIPDVFDVLQWRFDTATLDKFLLTLILLGIFVFIEHKGLFRYSVRLME